MSPVSRLVLGTVQFGQPYGVANRTGQPAAGEVGAILREAWRAGVRVLDTAPAYGRVEDLLGTILPDLPGMGVITKTVPLEPDDGLAAARTRIVGGMQASLRRMGAGCLQAILVHKVDDLLGRAGPAVLEALSIAKRDGLVRSVGVSVYDEAEIDRVLSVMIPDVVQVPFSILDRRLEHSGCLHRLRARGIEIHARSVFLQGLLLMDPDNAPAHFDPVQEVLRDLRRHWRSQGVSPLQGCLRFVLDHPDLDYALIGVDSLTHLTEVLEIVCQPSSVAAAPWNAPVLEERHVSPRLWPVFAR